MTAAISLRNVTRILADEVVPVTLVDGVTLDIEAGMFTAVTGASGSGKSSLLYLMGLLDRPTSGEIFLDGQNMTAASEEELQRARLAKIGFVFQFHFLLQEFSARDNILLPMRKLSALDEGEMERRADDLLAVLGLAKMGHKKPWQLSGGERQRVAIARALANRPLLVLADEPTGNLDSRNAAAVIGIFSEMVQAERVAVVTVTHDATIASAAGRRVVMRDGKIVEE